MNIPENILKGVQFLAPKERILVVDTDRFVAGAVFQKVDTLWYCIEAAPIINWMMGKSPEEIKKKILVMRARWKFLSGAGTTVGEDRSNSEREAPEALSGQTTAEPDLTKLPAGHSEDTRFDPQSYPDLKGVKPLDTVLCADVTCSSRTGGPGQDEQGVTPSPRASIAK